MNNTKYFEFYEECLKNGFINFEDAYQKQKITLLAKKYKIENYADFSISDFQNAIKKHDELTEDIKKEKEEKERLEKQKIIQTAREEEDRITKIVSSYSKLTGREKIVAMCNDVIKTNQAIVTSINVEEELEYLRKRKKIIPSAIVGGTVEGLTGSTIAGVYNAINHEEVNERKRVENIELQYEILSKQFERKKKAKETIEDAKRVLGNAEFAYIETNTYLAKNIVIEDLKMDISETGSLRVAAKVSMSKIDGLPNNINAYIDGTLKALIYHKKTNKVTDELLMTFGYSGLESKTVIEGVCRSISINKDNIDEFDCVFIDNNLFAVECNQTYPNEATSLKLEPIVNYLHNEIDRYSGIGSIEEIKKILVYTEYLESDLDEKPLTHYASETINRLYCKQCTSALNDGRSELIRSLLENIDYVLDEEKRHELEKRLKNRLSDALEREEKQKTEQRNKERKKEKKNITRVILFVLLIAGLFGAYKIYTSRPEYNYKKGIDAMEYGDYKQAYISLKKAGDYKDAVEYVNDIYFFPVSSSNIVDKLDEYNSYFDYHYDQNNSLVSKSSNKDRNYTITTDSSGRIETMKATWPVGTYTWKFEYKENEIVVTRSLEKAEGIADEYGKEDVFVFNKEANLISFKETILVNLDGLYEILNTNNDGFVTSRKYNSTLYLKSETREDEKNEEIKYKYGIHGFVEEITIESGSSFSQPKTTKIAYEARYLPDYNGSSENLFRNIWLTSVAGLGD